MPHNAHQLTFTKTKQNKTTLDPTSKDWPLNVFLNILR